MTQPADASTSSEPPLDVVPASPVRRVAPVPISRLVQPAPPRAPPWPAPEETTGRRFFALMVMLAVIGLYAWMLSFYYAGAHPGVDQAGYLTTARLIAGDFNPDNPTTVSRPAATKPPTSAPATAPSFTPAIWQGGPGYTTLHPAPAPIQTNPRFDWLRNRLSFVPETPFQFSSFMNIMTEPFGPALPDAPMTVENPAPPSKPAEFRYYAKYPFGYPLLAALGRTIASHWDKTQIKVAPPLPHAAATTPASAPDLNPEMAATNPTSAPAGPQSKIENQKSKIPPASRVGRGLDGMYIITPLCTVLACFFAFFLFRQAVSSFLALIGVLWLATNPIVLVFANDADSHAPTLMCVCAGFWGLISFLRTQQSWRAWVGGFALGYACTIRYSEFILVLPVAFAALVNLRLSWKSLRGSLYLLLAWAIPVAVLALVCYVAFGSPTKTGYWYCNEDTGFGWKYLTGSWTDREMPANWQTLLDQFNRNGLFVIWPLALAGLFGMIGTTWRLGGLIAAWVLPTLGVYLLYYWAPALGDQISLFYLRFFVSIIPGLIFAALWLLERALQVVQTSKGTALALASLLPVTLLLVIAFYSDGGPQVIDGGLGKLAGGLLHQTPAALHHLFSASRLGRWVGISLLAILPATWLFDRDLIAARIGPALGAGVITAIACAMNLQNIRPTIDNAFAQQTMARANVENLREILPRGTAFFGDNQMLQQLDCVGGYKLYDAALFTPAEFRTATMQLVKRNDAQHAEEPFPMQDQRWQFYKELLTKPDADGTPTAMSQSDLLELERALIEKNMRQGNRVVYVEQTDAGDTGGQTIGGNMRNFRLPPGFEKHRLRSWILPAMPETTTWIARAAFGDPRDPTPTAATTSAPATTPASPSGQPDAAREGPTFVLWEIIKK